MRKRRPVTRDVLFRRLKYFYWADQKLFLRRTRPGTRDGLWGDAVLKSADRFRGCTYIEIPEIARRLGLFRRDEFLKD